MVEFAQSSKIAGTTVKTAPLAASTLSPIATTPKSSTLTPMTVAKSSKLGGLPSMLGTGVKLGIKSEKEEVPNEFNELRKDLVRVFIEAKSTEKLLASNLSSLNQAAKQGDESAKDIVSYINDTKKDKILEKFLDKKTLSTEEAQSLITSIEGFSKAVSASDRDLNVSLSDLTQNYKELITDKRLDKAHRKDLLDEMVSFLEQSEVQSDSLVKLQELSKDQLALEGEKLSNLAESINTLSTDVVGRDIKTTLNTMSQSLDTSVLQQEELQEVMGKEVKSLKKSLKESLISAPGRFSGKGGQLLSGGLSAAFSMLGLDVLNMMGVPDLIGGGGFRLPRRREKAPKTTKGPRRRGRGLLGMLGLGGAAVAGGVFGGDRDGGYVPDVGDVPIPDRGTKPTKPPKAGGGFFRRLGRGVGRLGRGAGRLVGGAGRLAMGAGGLISSAATAVAPMALPALAVAGAGAAGYGIGTAINKLIDYAGGEEGFIAGKLYSIFGKDPAESPVVKEAYAKYATTLRRVMSPEAFNKFGSVLLAHDTTVHHLRAVGLLAGRPGSYKLPEEIVPGTAFIDQKNLTMPESKIPEGFDIIDKGAPIIYPPKTERDTRREAPPTVIQAPQVIPIPIPTGGGQGGGTITRKMAIDDYGIAFANSLLFD